MGEKHAGLSPNGSINDPAGIRALVYAPNKPKVGIESSERVCDRNTGFQVQVYRNF